MSDESENGIHAGHGRLEPMSIWIRGPLVLAAAMVVGCVTHHRDERLHSTLWVQTSAEFAISTVQVFRMAEGQIDSALADPGWSALDQESVRDLPPAVIVDVDETILDNSGYAARTIIEREKFRQETWWRWVREASAPALPGAPEYLRHAADLGITVFYVTNRHHSLEEATRLNLEATGCPVREDIDVLLLRDERPGWGRDKITRRDFVAKTFRVLQILGDDVNDFVYAHPEFDHEERVELVRDHEHRWGSSWFMLPNPVYGGWERALMYGDYPDLVTPLQKKFNELEPYGSASIEPE